MIRDEGGRRASEAQAEGPRAPAEAGYDSYNIVTFLCGLAALASVALTAVDIVIGSITGGNVAALPQTAVGRYEQLNAAPLLGLYNLDLLNLATSFLMLPVLYGASLELRGTGSRAAGLALAMGAAGIAVFAANNPALPMLGLARDYAGTADEARRALLAAAGEAVLAKGAHGSPGVLVGFVVPVLANLILCAGMTRSRELGRLAGALGLAGNALLLAYLVLVTFVPGVKETATAFAAPGGLLSIAWMTMLGLRLVAQKRRSTR